MANIVRFERFQGDGGSCTSRVEIERGENDVPNLDTTSPSEVILTGKRKPKRILHFSDGILEDYGSDEEEDENVDGNANQVDSKALIDTSTLTWGPYLWYYASKVGGTTLAVCDYLGEHLANFFGITSPKYQLEINEYFRMKAQEEEERQNQDADIRGWNQQDEFTLETSHADQRDAVQTQPSSTSFEHVKERGYIRLSTSDPFGPIR